jgi:hypothetical protein
MLASISPEYYLRLEQGHDKEPSDQVLHGLARALRLDRNAEQYLLRLRSLHPVANSTSSHDGAIPETVRELLNGWPETPAYVASSNLDVLLVNDRARRLGNHRIEHGLNLVEWTFSRDSRAEADWETRAAASAAELRYHGDPYDLRFQQVVGRLAVRDQDFRALWARHDARPNPAGRIRVDRVGAPVSHASFHSFEIPGTAGLIVTVLQEDNLVM